MKQTPRFLSPSQAARRLGVSPKALRLYEQRGLIVPARTPAGWRSYGPEEMTRTSEIVALRSLGFSIAQVARVMQGDSQGLAPALAAHQANLEGHVRDLAGTIAKISQLRTGLARGQTPALHEVTNLLAPARQAGVEIELPWPWGGELFRLRVIRKLTYIVGPLGSGKTRLALHLAMMLPNAIFIGLERLENTHATEQLEGNPALRSRVHKTLAWLLEEGALMSYPLTSLVTALEAEEPAFFIVDMVEQGMEKRTQQAVSALLRRRATNDRPIMMLTRSNVILDLAAPPSSDETIIFCPANHSPPIYVEPYPGSAGYEAVDSCLASPEVRERTAGVRARWQ